jgi:hypothetical protein
MMLFPLPPDEPVTLPAGIILVDHVKIVFGVGLERAMPVVPFEHKTCEDGEALTTGVGRTVMVMHPETALQLTPLRTNVASRWKKVVCNNPAGGE